MLQRNFLRFAVFLSVLYSAVYCNSRTRVEENAKKGELLFNSTGCPKCHSVSGEHLYGPPLNNIIGVDADIARNGTTETIKRNRKYIIRSIIHPEVDKLIDYKDKIMPPVNLSREEIRLLADYIEYINKVSE